MACNNTISILEMLSGRLFHDFANSMSGIMLGVEELEYESISKQEQKEAFSLVKESVNDLLIKYKIMKQAYSISGSNSCFSETRTNVENYLLKKKTKFVWDIVHLDISIDTIEIVNKIIANIAITISVIIAEVKEISILLLDNEKGKVILVVKILSQFSNNLIDKLKNKNEIDLDTKNINIYLMVLLLEQYCAKIDYVYHANSFELRIAI